jgi:hypothetical protein
MQHRGQAFLLAFALGAVLGGCGAGPTPVTVFSEQDARVVLEPQRFGWLSSAHETGALPSAIALGAKTSGRLLLYFEFPEVTEQRQLLRAQLLLDPQGGSSERVTVEVSRAAEAGAELRSWSDQPRALYPRVSAELAGQAFTQRLDVTEILRVPPSRGEPLRLLLRAEPGAGEGMLIATGAAGGAPPRLELYFQ